MADNNEDELLCGNASDNLYLTFKGGCREAVKVYDCYRCTGCGGRFHKDCILKHFELEKEHDWGRQQERKALLAEIAERGPKDEEYPYGDDIVDQQLNMTNEMYRIDLLRENNAEWRKLLTELADDEDNHPKLPPPNEGDEIPIGLNFG